jgi:hypothetical protein
VPGVPCNGTLQHSPLWLQGITHCSVPAYPAPRTLQRAPETSRGSQPPEVLRTLQRNPTGQVPAVACQRTLQPLQAEARALRALRTLHRPRRSAYPATDLQGPPTVIQCLTRCKLRTLYRVPCTAYPGTGPSHSCPSAPTALPQAFPKPSCATQWPWKPSGNPWVKWEGSSSAGQEDDPRL